MLGAVHVESQWPPELTSTGREVVFHLSECRDRSQFWRWPVLTAHNPDPTTLKLPDAAAWNIFTDFIQRGLLVPFVLSDGSDAYKIDLGKESEWRAVADPPGIFSRYLLPFFSWLFRQGWGAVVFLLGFSRGN